MYGKDGSLVRISANYKRIIVYKEKENKSSVDERDNKMRVLCKRAISQAQDIVLSDKEYKIPRELI